MLSEEIARGMLICAMRKESDIPLFSPAMTYNDLIGIVNAEQDGIEDGTIIDEKSYLENFRGRINGKKAKASWR
jgi:hypothetical protein